MHVSFIPYGERGCVEKMLRDMESQKHLMPMTKGKEKELHGFKDKLETYLLDLKNMYSLKILLIWF